MPRQNIYLGVEGNDGTGDSIREAFRKANENFTELYAVFGQGGTIAFTTLSDTPSNLLPSEIADETNPSIIRNFPATVVSNDSGTQLIQKRLRPGDGISLSVDDDNIIITNVGANVSADTSPILGGPLSGNTVHPIGLVATDDTAVAAFNTTHGTQITVDDLVVDKKFQDKTYAPNALKNARPVIARDEPTNGNEYTKTISNYQNGNIRILNHGFNAGVNGSTWRYDTTGAAPANLSNGGTYFLRVVDPDSISLHSTKDEAQNDNNLTRQKINIANGSTITPSSNDTLSDTTYSTSLEGFFKDNEAMPRKSTVRRQGDDLEGPLYLHDHPGDLAGITQAKSEYQAATKYYVDNTSFASTVDLYVSTSGDDTQATTPVGKEGRALNYAYRSVGAACRKAEELVDASPLEPGAYVQIVTHSDNDERSLITSSAITSPYADAATAITFLRENKRFIQKEVIAYVDNTYPNLNYASTAVENPFAEAILIANKKFLQEEIIAWIDAQIATNTGIWTGFTYNSDKCKRDAGYIIDAWIHDIGKGGNIETRRQASSYWSGMTSRVAGQEQQTVAAINYIAGIVKDYLLDNDPAPVLQDPIVAPQKIKYHNAEPGANIPARVDELTAVITDVITNGIEYLANPVEIDNRTCERDVGLIIDGMILDLQNGVNANIQAVRAGVRYYQNSSAAIARITQRTETLDAIEYAKSLVNQCVSNNIVSLQQERDINNEPNVEQFRDSGLPTVSQTVKNSLAAKFDIITNIIANGLDARPTLVEGSTYKIQISNGGNNSVDQGIATNVDILPGKIIRGRTTGALGRIVKYTSGADLGGQAYDEVEVVLEEPKVFNIGEEIEFGNFTKTIQICVQVETGIYYEDYPIKVPANVSIKGSDFRRTFIRPADRTSQSPWVRNYFYRDKIHDNLPTTDPYGIDLATNVDITITGTTTPGEEIIVTPADGISPFAWEGAWFYANGGRALVTQANVGGTSFKCICTTDTLDNLNPVTAGNWEIRQTSEYGYHYLTDPSDGDSIPKNNKELDVFLMNDATRLANMTFQGHGGFAQVLDPDGQILIKSPYMQVCGSFSQSINKQAFRGGMYIDGFSANSQTTIVSKVNNFTLNVQSAVGQGLRLRKPQTPCPFFIGGIRYQVDAISNYDGEAGSATLLINKLSNEGNGYQGNIFPQDIVLQTAGNRSMLANDYTQVNDLGYGLFVDNGALSEQVSTFTYYNHSAFFCNNGSQIRALNCSNSNGTFGLVAAGSDPNETVDEVTLARNMVQPVRVYDDGALLDHPAGAASVHVTDCDYPPYNNSLLDHYTATGIYTYEITGVSTVDGVTYNGVKGNNLPVYRLSVAGTDGLEVGLNDGDKLVLRQNKNFLFSGVREQTSIRPSTALILDEQPGLVYRTISFSNQDSDSSPLAADTFQVVFDTGFDFLSLELDNTYSLRSDFAGSGTTMGGTPGDRVLAVKRLLSQDDIDRIDNNDMIFSHAGKTHIVTNYTERTDAGNNNYAYATVTLVDLGGTDINTPATNPGLAQKVRFNDPDPATRFINLSLQDGELADITVSISVLRANGHDFNDIGSGGFNTSNYPNIIYGTPVFQPTSANEVIERGKGRVFYVSTDQDGFFRVGRFFEVDQGTGTVTFAASIAISNLDGLGFRRGVRISEFSNDDSMSDGDPQAVPTEFAVDNFINRRLHFLRDGSLVAESSRIGPGALARDGSTSMTGDLSAGGNQITNLGSPRSDQDQDATNKGYVDTRTPWAPGIDGTGLTSSVLVGRQVNDIIVNAQAGIASYEGVTPIGDISFTIDTLNKTVDLQIKADTITNADVKSDAAIAQSKLNLETASATLDTATGITQADLGSAHFHVDRFIATDGFVDLKDNGVPFAKIQTLDTNTVIGRDTDGTGTPEQVSFATVVEQGGTFTTTGVADSIVKTGSDGRIDAQSLYIDSTKILDQSGNELSMTTPGQGVIFTSVGTQPDNTTTTFKGSILVENPNKSVTNGVTASTFLKNSQFGDNLDATNNSSRLATNWIYTPFIEAPNERGAESTGISIGRDTGFTDDGEVGIVANNNVASVVFQRGQMIPGGTPDAVTKVVDYDVGGTNNRFRFFYGTAVKAQYADLAEKYIADQAYEAGTVLVFGGEQELTTTSIKGDKKVAGVVSENPATLMNDALEGETVVPLALQGRVPVKVIGKVSKGDILVTSAISGYAIVDNDAKIGTVIGKAVGERTEDGKGVVEVVVGRV